MEDFKSDLFRYIIEIGEYTFAEKEFSAVDALVLSQIVYMKFDEIAQDFGQAPMTLDDALHHPLAESIFADPSYGEIYCTMLELVCDSNRYQGTSISCYENCIDPELEHQFCGMVLHLPSDAPAPLFVAFRGTDETIIGWKENFNMAFLREIPSQAKAVDFLNRVTSTYVGKLIVAGHSKGGNLSIYSCAGIPADVQERILSIYSFDGPGFLPSFYRKPGYCNIEDKIQKIIPEHSLIGLLFSTRHSFRTIQSYANGLAQHEPLSWKIDGEDFINQTGIARSAYQRAQKINHWMQKMNSHERKHFINATFELLQSTEAGTVYELGKHPFQLTTTMLHRLAHWENEKKKKYHNAIKKYWKKS